MSTFTIDLDCAPGPVRPNDLFPQVIQDTGLTEEDFTLDHRFFGNWTWRLLRNEELYRRVQPIIEARIRAMYTTGQIRYGSW